MIEVYEYTHDLCSTNPNLPPINQQSITWKHELKPLKRYSKIINKEFFLIMAWLILRTN